MEAAIDISAFRLLYRNVQRKTARPVWGEAQFSALGAFRARNLALPQLRRNGGTGSSLAREHDLPVVDGGSTRRAIRVPELAMIALRPQVSLSRSIDYPVTLLRQSDSN